MEKDIFLLSKESPEGKDIQYKIPNQTGKTTTIKTGGNSPAGTTSTTTAKSRKATPPTPRPTPRPVTTPTPKPTAKTIRSSPSLINSKSNTHTHDHLVQQHQPTVTFPPQPPLPPSAFTVRLPPPSIMNKAVEELPAAAQSFIAQHCDMQNVPFWVPGGGGGDTNNAESWKLRAPYVILAGVWNGGVEPLSQALQLHPQIRKRGVGVKDFFLPRQFYKYQTTPAQGQQVKVFSARQRMYAQVYSKITTPAFKESISSTTNMVAMDVSPGYLFYASQTSVSIQCVSPWAKTVILLRDPVDRVYHQWVFGREKLGLRLPLEEWMAQELKAMQLAGLISWSSKNPQKQRKLHIGEERRHILLENSTQHNDDDQDKAPPTQSRHQRRILMTQSKEEEREAWKRYQSQRNLAGAIGRSMYVLQLEEWFETLVAVGKVPKDEVFLIRSEVWEAQPYQEYKQLISFLGLAPYTPSVLDPHKAYANSHNPPMKEETRQLLQDFFAPYNQRLAVLLQQYGFNDDGDWNEPLWKS